MNKFKFLILSFCFVTSNLYSSNSQWASKLIGFSTQLSSSIGSAKEVLGKPSIMIGFGSSNSAWSPKEDSNKDDEWIHVGFDSAQYVSQISIYENYNPGTIYKIIFYSELNEPEEIYENKDFKFVDMSNRMFYFSLKKTKYKVKEVKIILKTSHVPGFNQIDAIGISDELEPKLMPEINVFKDVVITDKPENLGARVNSESPELAPIITFDGRKLFFTRANHQDNIGNDKKQDIWVSDLNSEMKFDAAINIGAPLNNKYDNYAISISPSNNEMLLGNRYNADGTVTKGLSKSYFNGKEWGLPSPIEIEGFENKSKYGSYCLHSSGKIMIISAQLNESRGGNDLYISFLISNNKWSKPKSLGNIINTASDETSPFLAADGQTLYYSTSGLCGYGSNDMFISHRLDESWSNWSIPQNLGPNINSDGWDAYYTIPANGEYAYFVSNNNSIGAEDIFRIKLPQEMRPKTVALIKGNVLNSKDNKPIDAIVKYSTLSDGKEIGLARTDSLSGEFKIILPAGIKYSFLAEAKGFIAVNENIDLTSLSHYDEIIKNLSLVPIEKGSRVKLNNIFFEFKDFTLQTDSYPELERILKFMNDNIEIIIEIQGYTDNVGTQDRNLKLSQKRADAVAKYLIQKGLTKDRIKSKGYGKEKPVASNETDEGRTQNRRVEFEIIK
ncbi:MAG: OmpA family protein [Candidatus Kapabacteria bacterium]|nr:OmpA family protein [Candidatus Kapabacteria bacterium]